MSKEIVFVDPVPRQFKLKSVGPCFGSVSLSIGKLASLRKLDLTGPVQSHTRKAYGDSELRL